MYIRFFCKVTMPPTALVLQLICYVRKIINKLYFPTLTMTITITIISTILPQFGHKDTIPRKRNQ